MSDREEQPGAMQEIPEVDSEEESGGRDFKTGGRMKFKPKDMTSFEDKMKSTQTVEAPRKWFPTITVDANDVSIGDAKVGSMATLHAHAKVKRIEDTEDGKKITLEIHKGDAKPGLNPISKSGKKVLSKMKSEYGEKKGKSVFYASINKNKPGSSKWEITKRIKAGK